MKEVEALTHQAKVLRRDNSENLYYLQLISDIFKRLYFISRLALTLEKMIFKGKSDMQC